MTAEPVRRAEVALTAPALAHQWARQENGPHGAAVIARREISARTRGGVEWVESEAVAVSVIARPADLSIAASEVGWLAAGLAAADTVNAIECHRAVCSLWWPDLVLWSEEADGAGNVARASVVAEAVLGPGRVVYVVLTVRLGFHHPLEDVAARTEVEERVVADLRRRADELDQPETVVAAYRARCSILGRPVTVHRSPHGSVRGTAHDLTDDGALVLRSPTDLDEIVTATTTRFVEPAAEPDTG